MGLLLKYENEMVNGKEQGFFENDIFIPFDPPLPF